MKKIILALGLMSALSPVHAIELNTDGLYYGAAFGKASYDDVSDNSLGFPVTISLDDSSAFQIFVGIPLELGSDDFTGAIEVGFRDMGTTDLTYCDNTGTCVSGATAASFGLDTSADAGSGLYIDYVAGLPLNDAFTVQGIIGLDLNSDMDMLEYGLGAQFQATDQLGIRASYLFKETDEESVETNLMMLGVTYRQ